MARNVHQNTMRTWCVSYQESPKDLTAGLEHAMKIPIYVLGFGFVLSIGALIAQTAQQQPQQPTTPVNPSTPATQVGDGAQSKAGTPVQPTTTAPATTGGVAGIASS